MGNDVNRRGIPFGGFRDRHSYGQYTRSLRVTSMYATTKRKTFLGEGGGHVVLRA